MLRSVGIAVGPPEARVSIPLSGITTLIGANDAGKTTLIRAVQESLRDLAGLSTGAARAHDAFLALRLPDTVTSAAFQAAGIGLDSVPDQWQRLVDAQGHRDIVVRADADQSVWLARPAGAVAEDAELVATAGKARVDVAAYPAWMPIPLIRVADELPHLLSAEIPLALQCPAPPDDIVPRVQRAIAVLLEAFTDVRTAAVEGHLSELKLEPVSEPAILDWQRWRDSPSADPWLYPVLSVASRRETVHPDLELAAWTFSVLLERSLPSFITDTYTSRVDPSPLSRWIKGEDRVSITLCHRATGSTFDAEDLAEGFRLWMQLALIDACLDVTTLGNWVAEAFSPRQRAVEGHSAWLEDVEPAIAALRALGVLPPAAQPQQSDAIDALEQLARACSPAATPSGLDDLGSAYPLISLLDEPERQLHPRLQRQAAQWLTDRAQSRSTAYLIATHSVSFMGTDDRTNFLHIQRGASGLPLAHAIDAQSLQATDAIADELGLDRGELLGLVDQIVFVEGITDRAFIEALYGNEIRMARTVLLPLGGATKTSSVIPMTELLLRFTTAPVTVILDDVVRPTFERLANDADFRRAALRDKQVELRELARLVELGIELDRNITAAAISTKDIFDLIDESVVTDHLAEPGKAEFPGHGEARRLVGDGKWKTVYRERYGIDILDPETFALGGAEMRRRGLDVPELRRLLDLDEAP